MRISVLQENFNKALTTVKPAIGSRPTLPVLSHVCLETDNGRLKITATDLEMSIQAWVGARVEMDGAITIPAKKLIDLVKNLSPERADLESNTRTQSLHLNCGGTKVEFKGITADEFPIIPPVEGVKIVMSGSALQNMVGEVEDSVCKEDNRPVLTGVYMNFVGNAVTFASADGYRLTVCKGNLDYELHEELTAIVPVRTLTTVAKMVGSGKKAIHQVTISFDVAREVVSFDLGDIVVTSNLISGTFPMYENIVPKSSETKTIVYRDEFLRACKKALVFAKDSSNTVRFVATPSADGYPVGTLHVNAKSSEFGEISSMIDASITGIAIDAAYNVEYLIDVATSLRDDQLLLETINLAEPLVVRGVGRDNLYHVIMPMQVGQ